MKIGSVRGRLGQPPVRSYAKAFGDDRMILAPVLISWHDDDPNTPRAELMFDVVDGKLRCTGLSLFPAEATGVVTAADLRKIDLEAALKAVARAFSMRTTVDADGGMRATVSDLGLFDSTTSADIAVTRALSRTEGRQDKTFLQRVAKVYEDNIERAPTQAVADTFGVAHRTAGLYVQRARRAGLLAPVRPKKRGSHR